MGPRGGERLHRRAEAAGFAVELVCRTLGVSGRRTMNARSGRRSAARVGDEQLVAMIRELHAANFEAYGYRKMHWRCARRVEDVARDREAADARARHPGRQAPRQALAHHHARSRRGAAGPIWSSATSPPRGPDRLYVADFTYLRCWEGLVFFAFVIDVYSRRVVGWQLTGHMRASLVCDALRMAVCTRPGTAPTSSSSFTATADPNTRAMTSRRSSTITTCCNRSDRSATPRQRHGRELRRHASRPS